MKTYTATNELLFSSADRNLGQIVTYSSAVTPSGAIIDCRHDGSDGSVQYYWDKSQRRLTDRELTRYDLVVRAAK